MDINQYYINQAQTGRGIYPVFRGNIIQKGYGLSNVFKRFFRWFLPVLKENGLPVVKNISKDLVTGISNVIEDVSTGKQDFISSAKNELNNIVKKLETGQEGQGKKRSIKATQKCKKKCKRDLFKYF